jgi:hypothetical protein
VQGDYCAIGGQFHIDPFQLGGDPAEKGRVFLDATLAHARELDVPILSADEWLNFTDLRHEARFTDLTWDPAASSLSLRLLPPNQPAATLTVLLPTRHADKIINFLSLDGVTTPLDRRLVLGSVEYSLVSVSAQDHTLTAVYA